MTRALALAMVLVTAWRGLGAQQTADLARIQAMLGKPAVLCGAFEQSKTLIGLRQPVKSSGRFCVVAEKGVLWRTLLPFPASIKLTHNEIVEFSGETVTRRLSAQQEPTVRMINDLLFSVLAGELARLTSSFAVASKVGATDWQATLTPTDAGVKRVIAGIEMQGSAFVQHILIRESGGDRTEITFSAIATGQGAMLPDEARQFAQ